MIRELKKGLSQNDIAVFESIASNCFSATRRNIAEVQQTELIGILRDLLAVEGLIKVNRQRRNPLMC